MNIFVTSECPVQSAQFLDNARCVKMILESAQMLSTAINERGGQAPYKSTHKHHPATVWCGLTKGNWDWLFNHYIALCEEYTARFDKTHKTFLIKDKLLDGRHLIPDGTRTQFVNCARNLSKGIDFTAEKDTITAYQNYLNARWDTDKRTPAWN